MQFSAVISPDDYRDLIAFFEPNSEEERPDAPKLSAGRWALVFLLLLCVIGWFALIFYFRGVDFLFQRPIGLGLVVVTLLGIFAILMDIHVRAVEWFWSHDGLDHAALREGVNIGEARFDLRPEGLRVSFAMGEELHAWHALEGFVEGTRAFYLHVSGGETIILPKRAFRDQADQQAFADFVAERIGALR